MRSYKLTIEVEGEITVSQVIQAHDIVDAAKVLLRDDKGNFDDTVRKVSVERV
jgi:fructose-specific phosphotransferase system component IIB